MKGYNKKDRAFRKSRTSKSLAPGDLNISYPSPFFKNCWILGTSSFAAEGVSIKIEHLPKFVKQYCSISAMLGM